MRISLVVAMAGLAACSGEQATESGAGSSDLRSTPAEAEAASPSRPTPVDTVHMFVFDCGAIEVSDLDIFSTEGDYAGVSDTFVDTCFLIRHPGGDLMWDLGLPSLLTESEPQESDPFTVSLDRTLTEQLDEIGLTPRDVDLVSISHSHFDHTGQADQFLDATWLVYQAEYDAMFPPAEGDEEAVADGAGGFGVYASLNREIISGEHDVFGDGSVVIVPAPGHTPGHAYLQVTLPETGPVLLTGDLYHRAESRRLRRVPRFNWDVATPPEDVAPGSLSLAAMDEFEARAERLGAKVVIQHEPADIDALPKPPEALR